MSQDLRNHFKPQKKGEKKSRKDMMRQKWNGGEAGEATHLSIAYFRQVLYYKNWHEKMAIFRWRFFIQSSVPLLRR